MTYNIITKKFNLADSSKEKILDRLESWTSFLTMTQMNAKLLFQK